MPAEPQKLRAGEACHRLDPNDAGETGKPFGELGRLCGGASVIMQDRRTDRPVGPVEEDRAVHLARRSRSPSAASSAGAGRAKVGDRARHGGAPDVGILLRPFGFRPIRSIGARRAGHRRPALVGEERLQPGGAAVEPEIHRPSMRRPPRQTRRRFLATSAQFGRASLQARAAPGAAFQPPGRARSAAFSRLRSRM